MQVTAQRLIETVNKYKIENSNLYTCYNLTANMIIFIHHALNMVAVKTKK